MTKKRQNYLQGHRHHWHGGTLSRVSPCIALLQWKT
ncbi:hypothetical protein AWRI1631_162280 [Saccharomyces cerevisiae AWRI1631]|uniref:Uncharacterized protein n=1 Tax=Saccharomyces cerevisiae (strain AWRI1631) TaxID=545124 RepID=B5VTC3_YEAS6|nr:hypothetical protein AWRI1631_162280 [Saccharomyces cerevisiae AWRI1631]